MAITVHPVRAQVFDSANPNANNPSVPRAVRSDTARVRERTAAGKRKKATEDSVRRTEKLFGFRVTRPAKAGYLALIPGLGQAYNRRWWKLPLVYGAIGATVGTLVHEQRGLNEFVNAADLLANNPAVRAVPLPNPALGPLAGKQLSVTALQNYLVFFRHYRDGLILYTGFVYGLTVLDAIVDAHLHSFDVSDDLTMRWQPTLLVTPGGMGGILFTPGVAVALHFN